MDIVYVGYSNELLNLLLHCRDIDIVQIISQKGKLSDELMNKIEYDGIFFTDIQKNNDLLKLKNTLINSNVIMYKFGFIIPKEIIKKNVFLNIHPGNLRENRGAHPVRWSILLGNKFTNMTLYRIAGIDEGYIIHDIEIEISENDNYLTLGEKMDNTLPEFVSVIKKYFNSPQLEGYRLEQNGIYRPKVQERDYLIDIEKDSFKTINKKINAMYDFGGAIIYINGEKYRAKKVSNLGNSILTKKEHLYNVVSCLGERLSIECEPYIWKQV